MKAVFFGTPQFAIPSLEALHQSSHVIRAVVTRLDKRSGRGMEKKEPDILVRARELGLACIQLGSLRKPSSQSQLASLGADLFVVVAYGKILPPEILSLPPRGCVNLHPSLLPRFRGASPIQAVLMEGETRTGVTTMFMDEGMDTGPILLQRSIDIKPDDNALTLGKTLSSEGASLLVETLDRLEADSIKPRPQESALATECHPIVKSDGLIDWSRPASDLYNRFRAFYPWPGSFSFLKGKRITLHDMKPLPISRKDSSPGTILACTPEGIDVACGCEGLRLLKLQREGKKTLSATEFVAGFSIQIGDRFIAHS